LLDPIVEATHNRPGTLATCLPDTRQNVITAIKNWAGGGEDHPICWLNGPAGFGKSAIAQTIAQLYDVKRQLAGSFFFRRGEGQRSKIDRLIPTLSFQLSIAISATKRYIQRAVRSEPHITRQSLQYQFQKLMIDPIIASRRFVLMARRPVIVIDGLDECDDKESMAGFIEVIIRESQRPGFPFRIFITSRVEEHIRQNLDMSEARLVVLRKSLQDFDSRCDIRLFFKSRFATIYEQNHRILQAPWPSESDLDTLARKSEGSFIFAATLMDFVEKGIGHPGEKLQRALEAADRIDSLYMQVLSDAPRDDNFDRTLGTLTLLRSPLSITFLERLLQLETGHIVYTLLGIQSILMIPGDDDQCIQFAHTSFRDFLLAPERSQDYYIHPASRHLRIASDCLSAICERPTEGMFFEGGEEYACMNWLYHLRRGLDMGQDNLDTSLRTKLTKFLQEFAFDVWFNTVLVARESDDIVHELSRILEASQIFSSIMRI
jgi:hypothetical protein